MDTRTQRLELVKRLFPAERTTHRVQRELEDAAESGDDELFHRKIAEWETTLQDQLRFIQKGMVRGPSE